MWVQLYGNRYWWYKYIRRTRHYNSHWNHILQALNSSRNQSAMGPRTGIGNVQMIPILSGRESGPLFVANPIPPCGFLAIKGAISSHFCDGRLSTKWSGKEICYKTQNKMNLNHRLTIQCCSSGNHFGSGLYWILFLIGDSETTCLSINDINGRSRCSVVSIYSFVRFLPHWSAVVVDAGREPSVLCNLQWLWLWLWIGWTIDAPLVVANAGERSERKKERDWLSIRREVNSQKSPLLYLYPLSLSSSSLTFFFFFSLELVELCVGCCLCLKHR
jgi:hypothetical protein